MEVLSANKAKTQFGDMLMKAQRAPVQISKNGKPVAVVISADEFERLEAFKLRYLKARVSKAIDDVASNNIVEGESFFDKLELGMND
jgi:prevent-host-death family protein